MLNANIEISNNICLARGSSGKIFLTEDPTKIVKKFTDTMELLNELYVLNILEMNPTPNSKYILTPTSYNLKNKLMLMDKADCDLEQFLRKRRKDKLSNLKKIDLMYKIALGVKYIHDRNIVHGDLKSMNILMFDEEPKICDFGLGILLYPNEYVKDREIITIYYRPPEVFFKRKFNNSVDIWALGLLLYEIYTGGKFIFNRKIDLNHQTDSFLRNMSKIVDLSQYDKTFRSKSNSNGWDSINFGLLDFDNVNFKKLIMGMVNPNKDTRLTIDNVLSNPIFDRFNCRLPKCKLEMSSNMMLFDTKPKYSIKNYETSHPLLRKKMIGSLLSFLGKLCDNNQLDTTELLYQIMFIVDNYISDYYDYLGIDMMLLSTCSVSTDTGRTLDPDICHNSINQSKDPVVESGADTTQNIHTKYKETHEKNTQEGGTTQDITQKENTQDIDITQKENASTTQGETNPDPKCLSLIEIKELLAACLFIVTNVTKWQNYPFYNINKIRDMFNIHLSNKDFYKLINHIISSTNININCLSQIDLFNYNKCSYNLTNFAILAGFINYHDVTLLLRPTQIYQLMMKLYDNTLLVDDEILIVFDKIKPIIDTHFKELFS